MGKGRTSSLCPRKGEGCAAPVQSPLVALGMLDFEATSLELEPGTSSPHGIALGRRRARTLVNPTDRAAFPSVAEYLERLPGGCDSYPECVAKASFLCQSLKGKPVLLPPGALPAPIDSLIRQPPPMSAWIPRRIFKRRCSSFATFISTAAPAASPFRRWTHELALNLFNTPLYKALFFVISPARLLRGMKSRWHTFTAAASRLRKSSRRQRSSCAFASSTRPSCIKSPR